MKIFDLIGGLIIVVWIIVVGNVAWKTYGPEETIAITESTDSLSLTEGESWMLLRREGKEIGFVHETRTHLDKDWLFEYTLFINVKPIGAVKSEVKSRMSAKGVILSMSADTELGARKITLEAVVKDLTLSITSNLDQINKTIQLQKPPKLSSNVYRSLAAVDDLKPGDIYREKFFDAISLGMNELVFEYVGESTSDIYGKKVNTRHFIQKISGNELDVYIDKKGEVMIQEFPFQIIGARVQPVLGRSRAHAIRNASKKEGGEGVDLELGTNALIGNSNPHTYLLKGLQKNDAISLNSDSQKLVKWTEFGPIVDTLSRSPHSVLDEAGKKLAMARTLRLDFDAEIFDFASISSPQEPKLLAEDILKKIQAQMKVKTNIAILPASTVLKEGSGDCTEFALVLTTALRRASIPSRFVYGVKADEKGKFIAHQWVEYWNGTSFNEIDPTQKTGIPSDDTLRFFSSHEPESSLFLTLLDRVTISSVPKPEMRHAVPMDFN